MKNVIIVRIPMPNPRDIMEANARRMAEIVAADSKVARLFEHSAEVHAVFGRPTIIGEMQEAPSVTMETRIYGEPMFNVVKISPPSFLNKEQSEFFMSKFPLKGINE